MAKPISNNFFSLNKDKLRFFCLATSGISLLFAVIALTVAFFANSLPAYDLIIIILLTAGIGFPLFVFFLSYASWNFNHRIKTKLYLTSPLNQLPDIGFEPALAHTESKWNFTEIIRKGKLNGFAIICDSYVHNYRRIVFTIPVEWRKLTAEESIRLRKKFEAYKIVMDIGAMTREYTINEIRLLNIYELKAELNEFTKLVKEEGFEAAFPYHFNAAKELS